MEDGFWQIFLKTKKFKDLFFSKLNDSSVHFWQNN